MNMQVIFSIALLPMILLIWMRGMALLMFYQQEEYDSSRFPGWLWAKGAFDRRASLVLVLGAGLTLLGFTGPAYSVYCVAVSLGLWSSWVMRKQSKKPLVLTVRAKRIFTVYFFLAFVVMIALLVAAHFVPDALLAATYGALILTLQALPFIVMLANGLLGPFEARVKAKYRAEAVDILAHLNPTIIGVTGSFGKTSTKHLLAHVLSAATPTLATPGSVNTEMGITRIIREQLRPEHAYFIVEMGAYGPGSIGRLAAFTPPSLGLITAVGDAHYERFKTLEAVAQTKFELAEATIANGGSVIVSTDGIPADLLAHQQQQRPGRYITTGRTGDMVIKSAEQTPGGTKVVLDDKGKQIELLAPIFGDHQAQNMAVVAAAAHTLGLPWSIIKGAMATAPQTRHRLEVLRHTGAPTIIDDAYNANPIGFEAGLKTLNLLQKPGGKRILITPGIVELGARHGEEHARLGALAATLVDHAFIVSPDRIPTFVDAFKAAQGEGVTLHLHARQAEAEEAAKALWSTDDVVLFANNLPDLFEAKVRF